MTQSREKETGLHFTLYARWILIPCQICRFIRFLSVWSFAHSDITDRKENVEIGVHTVHQISCLYHTIYFQKKEEESVSLVVGCLRPDNQQQLIQFPAIEKMNQRAATNEHKMDNHSYKSDTVSNLAPSRLALSMTLSV